MPDVEENQAVDFDTSLAISMLENLKPECDNEGCSREAVLTIHCPCKKGVEFSCKPCAALLLVSMADIVFDPNKACGHCVKITQCRIDRI